MSFTLTLDHLNKILSNRGDAHEWYDACNSIFPKYGLITEKRVSAFLAQCSHESGNFKMLVENLNYSAQGLANTWPSRYAEKNSSNVIKKPFQPNNLALQIQRRPELIGNYTYANRMGNGDVSSGDGFRYRGRGLIQITGKQNYQSFADSIGLELDITVAYCETKHGAIESACWYWSTKNINALADQLPAGAITDLNFTPITKTINGGTIGLKDRTEKYNHIIAVLA